MAQMVDVRTDAEWAYVGFPDLAPVGKRIANISWQVYPAMQVNAGFVDALRTAGFTPEHKLFFLCRSGVRSLHAAEAASAAGFPEELQHRARLRRPARRRRPPRHRRRLEGRRAALAAKVDGQPKSFPWASLDRFCPGQGW